MHSKEDIKQLIHKKIFAGIKLIKEFIRLRARKHRISMTLIRRQKYLCPACKSDIFDAYMASTSSPCWEDGVIPEDAFDVPEKLTCPICTQAFKRSKLGRAIPIDEPSYEELKTAIEAEQHAFRQKLIPSLIEWIDYYEGTHEWILYRETRLKLADVFLKEIRWKDALEIFLEVIYFDMNGYDVGRDVFEPNNAFTALYLFDKVACIQFARDMDIETLKSIFFECATRLNARLQLPVAVMTAWEKLTSDFVALKR